MCESQKAHPSFSKFSESSGGRRSSTKLENMKHEGGDLKGSPVLEERQKRQLPNLFTVANSHYQPS